MAVTTIDIDSEILQELKDAYGIRTSKEAANFALHEVVMRRRQLAAVDAIAATSRSWLAPNRPSPTGGSFPEDLSRKASGATPPFPGR